MLGQGRRGRASGYRVGCSGCRHAAGMLTESVAAALACYPSPWLQCWGAGLPLPPR